MGWVLFDVGELGGFPMLEEDRSFPDRLWRLGVMLTGWAIAYWFLRNLDNLDAWVIDRLDRYLPITTPRARFRTKVARGVVRVFAVAGAGVVAVAFAETELSTIWFLFFALLPILNALADWISVAATRWFLAEITEQEKMPDPPLILWDLFLDFLVAAMSLLGLIASIIVALELWDLLFPETLLFDWRAYWGAFRADWTQGTALYLMCLTTLIPTILHLIAGIGAFFSHKSRLMHRIADDLDRCIADPDPKRPDLNDIDDALKGLRRATFWGYSLSSLLVLGPLIALVLWFLS
jgi:hypothetical protein